MTIIVLSNPKNFVREAHKKGVRYEYLKESVECNGAQKTARMFVGRCSRGEQGTLSAATLLNWLTTFEFVRDNPEKQDDDPFSPQNIETRGEDWKNFVELIKKPILEDEFESWKNLSMKKLGDVAIQYGMTIGVRNLKAQKTLLERMNKMYERRKENIWNKKIENIPKEDNDLRLKNVFELRDICKKKGIVQYHKTKNEMIQDIQNFEKNKDNMKPCDYENMTLKELKNLAKERIIAGYNKLNLKGLIEIHKKYDYEISKLKEEENKLQTETENQNTNIFTKEFQLTGLNGNVHNLLIRKDGFVNATMLCKAGNKKFHDYIRLKTTQEYIQTLESVEGLPSDKIIHIIQAGNAKNQGSYVHRLIAVDLARWICPRFAVQISKWIDELMTTGKVELKRPVKFLIDLKEIDIEAETIEMNNTLCINLNKPSLYLAYIGNGLVKVGYSSNVLNRENRHQSSSETEYPEFRLLKTFEISNSNIETTIHKLLDRFRVSYQKQKEIYKPPSTLTDFIQHIETLLEENDLQLQIQKYKMENMKLKEEIVEKNKKLVELKEKLLES